MLRAPSRRVNCLPSRTVARKGLLNIAKVKIMRCVVFIRKNFWYESMEWNKEKNLARDEIRKKNFGVK